jgi:serine/threonine protein kinase
MFMELLHGSALRDLLVARRCLRFSEAREIVLQAADGLAAAHAAGIVHRDIKPENLFIAKGSPAYVKILDFGISKFGMHSEHRLTAAGAPMGTPYYMAPEQVAGKSDLDERCDIYALGVVLYECVTGSVPFDAPTLPALSIKIFEGRYTPPSDVRRDAPRRLDEVVARAMALEPSARYRNMREFQAALEALGGAGVSLGETLESAPSTAPSATPGTRSSEEVRAAPDPHVPRRGRRAVAVGLGVAAIAGVAVALSSGKAQDTVTPDDAEVPSANDEPSGRALAPPSVAPPLPVLAPVTSPSSDAAANDASDAGTRVEATGAPPRTRAPKPPASAPSRAARDGLTEENPFGERSKTTF